MKVLKCLLSVIALFSLTACNVAFFEDPEFNEVVFDPSVAVPLGSATYNIESLFEQVDPNAEFSNAEGEVVTLVYRQDIQSSLANDDLELSDQQFQIKLASGTTLSNPATAVEVEVTETYALAYTALSGGEIDSLIALAGDFLIDISSDFNAPTSYDLLVHSIEINDEPIAFSGIIQPDGFTVSHNTDLENHKIFLHKDENGDISSNTFLFTLTYRTIVDPGSSMSSNDGLTLSLNLNNQEFVRIYGNFSQQSVITTSKAINLPFFSRFESGSISFANPRIKIRYDNSYGMPFSVDYSDISAKKTLGSGTALQVSSASAEQLIESPSLLEFGESKTTDFTIDANNSNLAELLNLLPDEMNFDLSFLANPALAAPQYNFALEESRLSAQVLFEIPFEFNMQDLQASQELGFNNVDLSRATGLLLRVSSENEMPVGGNLQLQFINTTGDVVFTVDEQMAFLPAEVSSDGSSSGSVKMTTDVILDANDLDAVESASRVRLVVRLNTTNAGSGTAVKFFSDDLLTFTLAAQVDLQLSSKGN